MSKGLSEAFTLNNAWQNMFARAKTDGWDGMPQVKKLTIQNFNSTVAYVHTHSSGSANPTTTTDGMPISTDTANSPSSTITLEDVDLSTIWVHTAGNQTIKYQITPK